MLLFFFISVFSLLFLLFGNIITIYIIIIYLYYLLLKLLYLKKILPVYLVCAINNLYLVLSDRCLKKNKYTLPGNITRYNNTS